MESDGSSDEGGASAQDVAGSIGSVALAALLSDTLTMNAECWECKQCTFTNTSASPACQICGAEPGAAAEGEANTAAAADSTLNGDCPGSTEQLQHASHAATAAEAEAAVSDSAYAADCALNLCYC